MNNIYISSEDHAKLRVLVTNTLYTHEDFRAALALRGHLARAFVVPDALDLANMVTLGARFEYRDLDNRLICARTLCLPALTSSVADGLSVLSPFGTAVLGCSVDDEVRWTTPVNTRRIVIRRVMQPGAGSECSVDICPVSAGTAR